MDCCKKEEDCCPCESMAPRIECLQAQINELANTLKILQESPELMKGCTFIERDDGTVDMMITGQIIANSTK